MLALGEILAQPATHALALLLVCIWLAMRHKCLGYAALGKSYEAVVWQGQWWRCATAVLAHVEWWHLLSNAHALLGYGWIEEQRGTSFFIHTTILIALLAAPIYMAFYHLILRNGCGAHHARTSCLGFSGVLFGLHTVAWLQLGAGGTPPLQSLISASILIPQASFVGHSAGILAGALVALLRLNLWVSPALSFTLAAAALAYTCAACPEISLSLPACFPAWLARLCQARRPQLVGGCLYRSAPPSADSSHAAATDNSQDSAAPVPRDEARAAAAAAAEARHAQRAAAHTASAQRLAAFQAQRDTRFSAGPSTPPNDSTARIMRYRGASPPSPA
ncbi:hypothetical protein COHA_008461 [Chlorella ohadii]|uniref:Peptidase S54 rhomboid domain-containing protein n=1 Tax=Chlorella ohadii TaxID=2649997 RepID=A0AAD5GYZ2_9CHLO|nr:hypothetical protein COHA_008461 [Chlorella ohadii]